MMHVVGTTDQGLERAKTNFTANVTEAKLSDPEWQLLTGNIRIVYNFTPEHFCRVSYQKRGEGDGNTLGLRPFRLRVY